MTLYVVQAKGDDDDSLVQASFIPDRFSWPAFVFGPFWVLYRGLWLTLIIWVVVEVAYFALVYPHVAGGVTTTVDALAHLFIGFEGNRLRQSKLARSAVITDLVEARDRDEAEASFYSRRRSGEGLA